MTEWERLVTNLPATANKSFDIICALKEEDYGYGNLKTPRTVDGRRLLSAEQAA
jgi:hypothetical protein